MNKKERIGVLRNRVTIQGVTEVQSVTGYPAETWATYATRWASVEYLDTAKSNEEENVGTKIAQTAAKFVLRYDSIINQKQRIVYAGMVWDVRNVIVDAKREFVTLTCITSNETYKEEAIRIATANWTANATLLARIKRDLIAEINLFGTSTISATASIGNETLLAEMQAQAQASITATAKAAKQASLSANASGALVGNAKVAKIAQLTAMAYGTLSALAVSEQQGVQVAYGILGAYGNLSASARLAKQASTELQSSGQLQASAILAKVAILSSNAAATLTATLAAIRVASAGMTATAQTTLSAKLAKAVTANMNGIAQTTLSAKLANIASVGMTATAQTSVLAILANQVVLLANASGTLSATIKRAKLPSFAGNAAATISATGTVITPSVGDPYWANVTLLLRGNSSPITDEKAGYTFNAHPAAPTINTSVKKFGAGSILFANGGYLYNLTNDNTISRFGTSNFTVEFWVRFTSVAANQIVIGNLNTNGSFLNGWALYLSGTGTLSAYGPSVSGTTTVSVAINTWYHIALTRSVNTWQLFKDGIADYGAGNITQFEDSGTVQFSTGVQLYIGGYGNNSSTSSSLLRAYLDDIRITRDVARYNANFTPPTAEFPNS